MAPKIRDPNVLRDRQSSLELKLGAKLRNDSSQESFTAAYNQLHTFFSRECHQKELYPSTLRWFSRIFPELIGSHKTVLDIGTGNGKMAITLSKNRNQVIGIDISTVALDVATHKLKENSQELDVSFQYGDARSLSFPESTFDCVVSHDVIEHISEEDFLIHLQEVLRVLKSDGRYLFWTPSQLRGGSSLGLHLREYSLKDLVELLKCTDFTYEWIDLRLYKLGLKWTWSQTFLPIVVSYESFLRPFIGFVPNMFRKILVPPLFFVLTKS